MISKFSKHISVLLSLLMIITAIVPMFVIPASAAGTLTVTDDNIGLSWTDASNSKGTANWTASGTTVTGTAKGYNGGFLGLQSYTVNTILTITNNHSDDRTLSFDYSLTDGGSVSGIISGTSGSYSETLAAGASVTITLTSPKGTSTNTLTISGLVLLSASNVTSTFLAPENGSYTVDGVAVTEQKQLTKPSTESYALVATPATDYIFFGWWSEVSQSYVSYEATASLKFSSDPQLKPVFLHNTTALFGVGTKTFADLTEAANFANSSAATTKTVLLLNNGTVSGNHTIPAGITLLIPYNDSNTQYGANASCTSYSSIINNSGNKAWVQPTAYRTMTLAANAKITVNGSIELAGQHAASNGSERYCGAPTGPLGWMKMLSGSNITLNSGANLYCWGYIQGGGTITAKSGSKVYENFQFTDFRGGTNTSALASEGLAFPINQYYVQNIEVATTYEYGAEEHIATSIFMSNQKFSATVKFMGDGGMFVPASGATITKDYIENRDRLQIDVNGNGTLNSMSLALGGTNINSATFVLPMTNNISINIHSGTTTVNQSVSLLPGSEMTIDNGATLVITKGNGGINNYTTESFGLIVYDYDEWTYGINLADGSTVVGKYAFGKGSTNHSGQMSPLVYVPGRTYNRTVAADLKDAKLDVNGTIICDGYIYTTIGGGNIMSSAKTGHISLKSGAGSDMMDFQANDSTALVIPMHSAQLKNGDGSYVSTYIYHYDDEGSKIEDYKAAAGETYDYCATHDCWYTVECEKCAVPTYYEITFVVNGESFTQEIEEGTVPSYSGTPTKAPDANGHYTFVYWVTDEGTVLYALPPATQNANYHAEFKREAHDDDKIEGGKHYCSVCDYLIGSCEDTNNDHKCDVGGENMTCVDAYLTEVKGKDATCDTDGWNDYYQCSCGKYYEDGEAKKVIPNLDAWKLGAGKIPATGNHAFNNKASDQQATPADCENAATYYVQCDHCDAVSTEKTVAVGEANGHAFNNKASDQQATAADCENAATYYVQCDNCDAVSDEKTVAVGEANGHAFNNKASNQQATAADCENAATYYVQCDNCDAVSDEKTVAVGEANGHAFNNKASDQQATAADCENAATYYVQCDNCDAVSDEKTVAVGEANGHNAGEVVVENNVAPDCENAGSYDNVVYCTVCNEELSRDTVTVDALGHNYEITDYDNNGNDHTVNYVCKSNASHTKSENGPHDYNNAAHTCACGDVETFTLSVYSFGSETIYKLTVPYGADLLKVLTKAEADGIIPAIGNKYRYNNEGFNGEKVVTGYSYFDEETGEWVGIEGMTMPADNIDIDQDVEDIGWQYLEAGTTYAGIEYLCGWNYIEEDYDDVEGGAWYYFDNEGYRAEGITRAPYPEKEINGNQYVSEDSVNTEFKDNSEAWFIFDENGKFQYTETGIIDHDGTTRYAVNGMIPWHYGLATDGTDYFYFVGDTENGGNKLGTGNVYMVRSNGLTINGKAVFAMGVYTYDTDGKLCLYEGIIKDGNVLRYYYDYCMNAKSGLIKLDVNGEDKFIYVSSSDAELTAKRERYIGENKFNIVPGKYLFDANGYLVDAKFTTKTGIFFEDGAYYYYENGERAYAGLIKYTGTASDGTVYDNAYIYVRYNGELATGRYWITKSNDLMDAKSYEFNEKGIMDMRNGIVEENGSLYYYEDGVLAEGKGLIKIGEDFYYVRNSGEVVNNCTYWITNTNDYGVQAKKYVFDENGVMQDVEMKDTTLNGVVDGYYYVDGQIVYGAGPIVWNGNIYYVRSNGQVATGTYWTTVENEILNSDIHEFDESGKLIK